MTTVPQYSSSGKKACLPAFLKPFPFALTTNQQSCQIANNYPKGKNEYYFDRKNSFYVFYHAPPFIYSFVYMAPNFIRDKHLQYKLWK